MKKLVAKTNKRMSGVERLRAYALALPGAHEDFPWGERVAKVAKKVFVFLGHDDEIKNEASPAKKKHIGDAGGMSLSVKLPHSGAKVLRRSFASPTAYGLGAKGWVSLTFPAGEHVPLDELTAWIEESYRAVAPKTLVAELDRSKGTPGTMTRPK